MKELAMIFALITLGAAFVFFLKGILEVRAKADDFNFGHFIEENANRLYLLSFGLIITAFILFLDPGGLGEIAESLPVTVQLTSPLMTGAALAGATLIMPRKSPPAIEP